MVNYTYGSPLNWSEIWEASRPMVNYNMWSSSSSSPRRLKQVHDRDLYDAALLNNQQRFEQGRKEWQNYFNQYLESGYGSQINSSLVDLYNQYAEYSPYIKKYTGDKFKFSDSEKAQIGLDLYVQNVLNQQTFKSFILNDEVLNTLRSKDYTDEEKQAYKNFIEQNANNPYAFENYKPTKDEKNNRKIKDAKKLWDDRGEKWKLFDPAKGLNIGMQDRVADRLGLGNRALRIGHGVAQSAVSVVGNIAGLYYGHGRNLYLAIRDHNYNLLNPFVKESWNSVIDNEVTQWSKDLFQYGEWTTKRQRNAKDLGLSSVELVKRINPNVYQQIGQFLGETAQQEGFTIMSMAVTWGASLVTSKILSSISKGVTALNTASKVGRGAKVASKLMTPTKIGAALVTPLSVAAQESSLEALTAKEDFLREGKLYLQEQAQNAAMSKLRNDLLTPEFAQSVQQQIDDQTQQILSQYKQVAVRNPESGLTEIQYIDSEGNSHTYEEAYKESYNTVMGQLQKKYVEDTFNSPDYQNSLNKIEEQSEAVLSHNYFTNMIILGAIRTTFTSFMYAPSLKESIRATKALGPGSKMVGFLWNKPMIFKNLQGNKLVMISQSGIRKVLNHPVYKFLKLPVWEGAEEGLQGLSSTMWQNGYAPTAVNYINSLYHPGGYAQNAASISGTMWGNFNVSAGRQAVGERLHDPLLWREYGMGAVGSLMIPGGGYRIATGESQVVTGPGGVQIRMPETTFWHRGVNEDGSKESNWHRFWRVQPFHLAVTKEIRQEKELRNIIRQSLQNFIDDPQHKQLLSDLSKLYNLGASMDVHMNQEDEFGARNTALGQLIHAIVMLRHLKGSDYYKAEIDHLQKLSKLSEQDAEFIDQILKEAAEKNVLDTKQSQEEQIKTIAERANNVLQYMQEVETEYDKAFIKYGLISDDVTESLIYGNIQLKQLQKRKEQLQKENAKTQAEAQVKASGNYSGKAQLLNPQQQTVVAVYGTIQEIQKQIKKIEKELEGIVDGTTFKKFKEQVQEATGKRRDKKKVLSRYEKHLKSRKKTLERDKKLMQSTLDILDGEDVEFNELNLLQLDTKARTMILFRGIAQHNAKEALAKIQKQMALVQQEEEEKSEEESEEEDEEENELEDDELQLYTDEQVRLVKSLRDQIGEEAFQNLIDEGKVDASIEELQKERTAIESDPNAMATYAFAAKALGQRVLAKQRYNQIAQLTNYDDFTEAMTELMTIGTEQEKDAIIKALQKANSPNFVKWAHNITNINNVLKYIKEQDPYTIGENNTEALVKYALHYLKRIGVDVNDEKAVLEALEETDENGKYKIKSYIDEQEKEIRRFIDKTSFLSPVEISSAIKALLEKYNVYLADLQAEQAPIVISDTKEKDNHPAKKSKTSKKEEKPVGMTSAIENILTTILEGAAKPLVTRIRNFIRKYAGENASAAQIITAIDNYGKQSRIKKELLANLRASLEAFVRKDMDAKKPKVSGTTTLFRELFKDETLKTFLKGANVITFIRQSLRDNLNKKVYFMYHKDLGSGNILAVIEHEGGTIEAGGKTYQVIGVLQNNSELKEAAKQHSETSLLSNPSNALYTGTLDQEHPIIANVNDRNTDQNTKENRISLQQAILNDMLQDGGVETTFSDIFSSIEVKNDNDTGEIYLIYNQDNLWGKTNELRIFVEEINDYINRNKLTVSTLSKDTLFLPVIKNLVQASKEGRLKTAQDFKAVIGNYINISDRATFSIQENGDVSVANQTIGSINNLNTESASQLIWNLIRKPDGSSVLWGNDPSFTVAKWQVTFNDSSSIASAFDKGILQVSNQHLQYEVQQIQLSIDNARKRSAQEVVKEIQQRAKSVKVTDEEYEIEGKSWARTTHIGAKIGGTEFDPSSPWYLPSTSIGNSIDEHIRKFFEGIEDEECPNCTEKDVKAFNKQLLKLQNELTVKGLTVVSRDITVFGTLNLGGRQIRVAGTLDLLCYDSAGNFYIYDIKTHRNPDYSENIDKWSRQLSIYAALLEQQYGVTVKGLSIVPIQVTYADVHTGTYTKESDASNQLIFTGKTATSGVKVTSANPTMGSILNLSTADLTMSEQTAQTIENKFAEGEATDEIPESHPLDTNKAKPVGPKSSESTITNYDDFAKEEKETIKTKYGIYNSDDWEEQDNETQDKIINCIRG